MNKSINQSSHLEIGFKRRLVPGPFTKVTKPTADKEGGSTVNPFKKQVVFTESNS